MRRRFFPIALLLAGIALLCTSIVEGAFARPALADAPVTSPITVTITDNAFSMPDTLPSGRVAITYTNQGTQPHSAQIFELQPGVTMDQFGAAAAKFTAENPAPADFQSFFAMIKSGGGANTLAPGQSETVVNNLTPGNAVLVDLGGPGDLVKPFQVVGPDVETPEPQANVNVTLVDDAFQMPSTVPAGMDTFKVTDGGKDVHEFALLSVGNHTLADVQAALQSPQPPDWAMPAGGAGAMGPGETAWVTENIQPGNYVAICFVPDPETGMPHFLMGMIMLFTAQGSASTSTSAAAQPQASAPMQMSAAPSSSASGAAPMQISVQAPAVSTAGSAFTVTLSDSGAINGLPGTLPPGPTQITFVNSGMQPQGALIFQPKPGVTLDQLEALGESQEDFVKFLSLITAYAGADDLSPGMSENVTVNLDPGSYIMADMDTQGPPNPSFFQVSGNPTGANDPQAGYIANEFDDGSTFRFDLPSTIAPGPNTLKVTNTGTQQHEFELVYIGNHTLADVQAAIQQPAPPDWAIPAGGLQAQEPGMTSWVTVDFQSGNYAVLCFMPDPKTGQPHAALGMVGLITVP